MNRFNVSKSNRLRQVVLLAMALAVFSPMEADAQLRGTKEVEKTNTPPPHPALNAPPGLPGGPPQAPIDGGLGLLAAAGGAYAANRLRNRKRKEEP